MQLSISQLLVGTVSSNLMERYFYGQRVISVFSCQGKRVTMATKMINSISVFMAYKAQIRWRSFVVMDNELSWQQEESSISQLPGDTNLLNAKHYGSTSNRNRFPNAKKTNSLSVIVCLHAFELHKYHLGKFNCIPFVSEETVINS